MQKIGLAVCALFVLAGAASAQSDDAQPAVRKPMTPGLWEKRTVLTAVGGAPGSLDGLPKAVNLALPLIVGARDISKPQITVVTTHSCWSKEILARQDGRDRSDEALRSMVAAACSDPIETKDASGVSELCLIGDGYSLTHSLKHTATGKDAYAISETIAVATPEHRMLFSLSMEAQTHRVSGQCGSCVGIECDAVIEPPEENLAVSLEPHD